MSTTVIENKLKYYINCKAIAIKIPCNTFKHPPLINIKLSVHFSGRGMQCVVLQKKWRI